MRVLLIEDAPRLAEAVAEILRKGGYDVDVAHMGADGLDMAASGAYDVVLLDIMLPDMSGMAVLRDLRATGSAVPVILLTARQGVGDRVAGLDAGADDYLPKPFHASELLARIRAVTRRPATYRPAGVHEAFGLTLDEESRTLTGGPGSASIGLTRREAQLLGALMGHPGSPLAKSAIIARLWGPNAAAADNRLEVLVHGLREKLGSTAPRVRIETVRGVGYRLVEASHAEPRPIGSMRGGTQGDNRSADGRSGYGRSS